MAKNVDDTCMFCGESPCSCNAPKKKVPAKRAVKKVEPVEEAAPVVQSEPARELRQPSMMTSRKPLESSKRPIRSGPVKPMEQRDRVDQEDDEEFTRALRTLNFHGILAPLEQAKYATRLRLQQPTSETNETLARVKGGKKEVEE